MIDLRAAQAALYEAVRSISPRSFVRLCADDTALWVSDLPRHAQTLPDVEAQQVLCRVDEQSHLLYMDWTAKQWEDMLSQLPREVPSIPSDERLHPAYALCRLWMLHPASCQEEHLPVLRGLLKMMLEPQDKLLRAIPSLYASAAQTLRSGMPMNESAGRLLAAWLLEKES